MKKIYLCGHTGSQNRGCEAIVRSISYILNNLNVSKSQRYLLTYDKNYDEFLNLNEIINLIQYKKKNIFIKAISFLYRKFSNNSINIDKRYYKSMLNIKNDESILFTVGGDTYCYDIPHMTYACNEYAKERGIPNVFYGCSIKESTVDNKEMCDDINKYSYIIVRESLSKSIFEKILNDKSKLLYACDPAFQLPIKNVELPSNFIKNNTVGINLSPLVFSDYKNLDDIMYKNIFELIDYILKETSMNICLIPHVYNVEKNTQDLYVLKNIYNNYKDNNRLSIINEELSCTELKYIISQCRFFIGARTHATIAAYSTEIPTIVLSYSIKSRGIVKDLFGKEEGYLIKWQDIKTKEDIKKIFISSLLKNENKIIENYKSILPEYKKTIIYATKKILDDLDYKYEK